MNFKSYFHVFYRHIIAKRCGLDVILAHIKKIVPVLPFSLGTLVIGVP
jgi:hypothetical protein